ncbi:hypothetical protein B296_00038834 [Ensete ventricosum]|uniref:Retrotransposon gag domain-containing protein n=1 Tax=Ensete ventricosum TaxID=4639 RepID=A0A426YS75_ENSVE|nr:hypothetical protein B296_00038834 [Ensete ventricosum]
MKGAPQGQLKGSLSTKIKREELRRLREQLHKIRRTRTEVKTRAEHPYASSLDYTALGPSFRSDPLGRHAAKRPEPSPNASAHSFLDPDTLSSDSTDSLREQLHLVNQRIDDVRRTLRMKDERGEGPLRGSPFVQEIQEAPIPSHFHLPMLEAYDGRSDPMEHVATFLMYMTMYGTSNTIMEFEANFLSSARPKPTVASLLRMRQKEEEHLSQYLTRFIDKVRAIPDVHPSLVIQAFMIEIRSSRLFWSLMEQPPTIVPEILQRANEYIAAKILVAEKREDQKFPRAKPSRGPPPGLLRRRMERGE